MIFINSNNTAQTLKQTGWWQDSLTRWALLLAAGWTLVVAGLLACDLYQSYRREAEEARTAADAALARDMAYRQWVQKSGGVYVPVSAWSPPNPNLAAVAERDVVTPSGRELTLVNSSYMFRQVTAMAGGKKAVSRTTSLKPLRPENAPSPREAEALERFDAGERNEIVWTEETDGEAVTRVIRPFLVEEACLKCHAQQGYKIGDVRGGITVTVPAPTVATQLAGAGTPALCYGLLWLAGLAGLTGAARSLRRVGKKQQETVESRDFADTVLRTQFEISPDGVLVVDQGGTIVLVNRRFKEMMRVPEELLTAGHDRQILEHVAGQVRDREEFLEKVKHLRGHPEERSRGELALGDGRILDRDSSPMKLPDGQYAGRIWFFRDITERKRTEEQLRESEEKYRAIFAAESDGIVAADFTTGKIMDCNNAILEMYGYSREELIGRETELLLADSLPPEAMTTSSARISLQYHRKKDGTVFPVEITFEILALQGGPVHLATIRDITQRKAMEDELRAAALTDRLTGLPNRTLLLDRLQQAIERHKRLGSTYAVLFLDLDRFKTINDSLGHKMGDQLLSAVAKRLTLDLRGIDTISRHSTSDTAARLGGDEFVILLESLESDADAARVAQRLQERLSEPYILGEHEVVSTASIGIVISGGGHDRAEDVLRDADTAMYESKLGGRGRVVMFDGAMRNRVQQKMELESGMRRGLETGQFLLEYQPIVSLEDGRLEGLEALVRWQHPRHGLISPGEFIPLAEETGLIVPLGEWVFREACRQMAQWQKTENGNAVPTISVNLSRNQLLMPGLPERLHKLAQEAGVEPRTIHLEVTESTIMADSKLGAAVLRRLRELGFKIDMDDFGTGYSSLSCLQEFPIDVLKIDRSFIKNLNRGRDYAALVHAISTLAGNLGIKVVAEGVETAEQLSMLQALECHFAQGYYFAGPMRADLVMEYVAKQREAVGVEA